MHITLTITEGKGTCSSSAYAVINKELGAGLNQEPSFPKLLLLAIFPKVQWAEKSRVE